MFRKTTLTTTLLAAVAVKKSDAAAPPPPATAAADDLSHFQCKPSDLPLYAPLHSLTKHQSVAHPPKESAARQAIECGVRVVRTEIQAGYNIVASQFKAVEGYVDTAKAHSLSTIDHLNQPQNVLHRSGAIAIGGLAGFIFAARGGFIKKVLYTTIGAGTIASLCYPRQAEQFARDTLYETRKGYAIAYNFVKGVKPGDEIPVEPINKFPTSIGELKDIILDFYDEAKDVVLSKKK